MNTCCPRCEVEIRRKDIAFFGTARCSNCKAYLRPNQHPSEVQSIWMEPVVYVVGVLAYGVLYVPTRSTSTATCGAILIVCAYGAWTIYKMRKAIPNEWRRWSVSSR